MRKLLLMSGICCGLLVSPSTAQDQHNAAPQETLLMVSAEGAVDAVPDTMTITLGVGATGETAAEALNASADALDLIMQTIEREGQGIRHISTEDFGVQPIFPENYDDEADVRILGYSSGVELEIEFSDFETAGLLIPALFEAGASNVRGPFWSIEDEQVLRRLGHDATRLAIQSARDEAAVIADASGLRITRIVRISDANPARDRYINSDRGRLVVTGSRVRAIPIIPRPVEVERNIYIEFALVSAE